MTKLINGRKLADAIRSGLPNRIQRLPRKPGLAVALVGNDPASELYVQLKSKAAAAAGIDFSVRRFDDRSDENALITQIRTWNENPRIDAILVQLPLPPGFRENLVVDAIDPEKDADGFHRVNTARYISDGRTNPPGLVEGILRLIATTEQTLHGATVAIVARQSVFTDCLIHACSSAGASAIQVKPDGTHREVTSTADVVVVAAGRPGLISGDDLKPGCIVIDIGINRLPDGTIVGDVDRPSVNSVAGWLTPVPGGVGPMTIAMLLENTVRLAEKNQA